MQLPKQLAASLYPSAFFGCLAVTLFALWPGLTGPFLFDDFTNLEGIAHFGGLTSFDNLRHFIFSGPSSISGRPVAMLSFAINDQYWPSEPWAYKYTNVLLHLLNAVVLCALLLKIARILAVPLPQGTLIAILATTAWLLHPLNISSVLYIVQRMTELMALFVLAGLWCYVHGREKLNLHPMAGYLWMSLGIGFFGILAILSKENGALLTLFAIVMESTLLSQLPRPRHWRVWSAFFLFAPMAILIGYTTYKWSAFLNTYALREFTPTERLMTESRILLDYLSHIIVPRANSSGLYHDDYPISTGLISPISTLISIVIIVILNVYSIIKRKQFPVLSFAVLWFFAGHLMESSILPLELYFEHRNYVPMIGILFAVCFYAVNSRKGTRNGLIIALCLFIGLELFVTRQTATTWGNTDLLHSIWAKENPTSRRAQQLYAQHLIDEKRYPEAVNVSQSLAQLYPKDLGTQLLLLETLCLTDKFNQTDFKKTIELIPAAHYDSAIFAGVSGLIQRVQTGQCPQITHHQLLEIMQSISNNKNFSRANKFVSNILFAEGEIYVQLGQLSSAIEAMDRAFKVSPTVSIALRQAVLLASAGLHTESQQYLQIAITQDKKRNPLRPSRQPELARLNNYLEQIKYINLNSSSIN